MGVRGLHGFVGNACPSVCTVVNLKEMAEKYQIHHPGCTPVIVVDAMCCLRHWYTPKSWVCGGQWLEYLSILQDFIKAFNTAGIKLVFFFDGVVEQNKRHEWVKRRLRDNKEISRIFQFIKTHRQQPSRNMFFIPSGLAIFTIFALKSLGQETMCSLREADYEVASYGLQNNCLGILGEDTDYLIYNTCPYFSVNKLCLDRLITVMFSRENLCHSLGLNITDLPLLACILGNDIVPEGMLENFRQKCLSGYPFAKQNNDKRTNTILAVADYIARVLHSQQGVKDLQEMLPLGRNKTQFCRGILSYLLPGQQSPWLLEISSLETSDKQEVTMCSDPEILQIAKKQHIQAESYLVYNILRSGEIECSNTLEDEFDPELPGQALIYRPARQHIYSLLLEDNKDACNSCPIIKEWFVYFGNQLKHPELVQPIQLDIPGGTPSLRTLWLSQEAGVQSQRYDTFLACFHLQTEREELQALDNSRAALCCLLLYLLGQVDAFSLEDVNAFIAQTLCLQGKSVAQLSGLKILCFLQIEGLWQTCIKHICRYYFPAAWAHVMAMCHIWLTHVDSRAVHLGSLFVRGLTTLILANNACGLPFRMDDLMAWKMFDGKLFQQKYQQSHRGCPVEELLEGNKCWLTEFQNLKSLICKACLKNNRALQSRQRGNEFIRENRRWDSSFQRPHQSHFAPSFHNPNQGHHWRGFGPGSSRFETGPSGRGYKSEEQNQKKRRFQHTPRWPR
ncbi:constitutive coactivator of peroxisome proliferator-activated receptor gamma isoform X1 [Monodelphis domestica]|nr:constitutive coactivator of peroxisome proliferator-activated receptor gamma isoform X1 [Monodelphis domestica]XP_056675046.1 constitutive coactivator of peroxisome proliferator-activated receptor gamma isoform X1 [Monodelphis domestica]